MVGAEQFKAAARRAVRNVARHGDTDIFPFPFENHIFYDRPDDAAALIEEYDHNFDDYLIRYSPFNVSSLTPVTHSGFRWATQLDPIWNVYLLATVIALADKIETARVPVTEKTVFSYRYKPNDETGDLFDRDIGWVQFIRHSQLIAKDYSPTARDDYDRLRDEIAKFDIVGLLKEELAKSQVHIALTKKIVSAIRYLDGTTRDDAVLSILNNYDVLYPIFASALMTIDDVFDELSSDTQSDIIERLHQLIREQSHVFRVDVHSNHADRSRSGSQYVRSAARK